MPTREWCKQTRLGADGRVAECTTVLQVCVCVCTCVRVCVLYARLDKAVLQTANIVFHVSLQEEAQNSMLRLLD